MPPLHLTLATSRVQIKMIDSTVHIPVMTQEVMKYLRPETNQNFIDATLGGCGHATSILKENSPGGRVLAIDADINAISNGRSILKEFGNRIVLAHSNLASMQSVVNETNFPAVDGVLMDLGISSHQLSDANRGFSFKLDGPLDMRMDQSTGKPASEVIKHTPEKQLADLLFNLGGERNSRRIARAIVRERSRTSIASTLTLANLIIRTVGFKNRRLHPATKTFQALRIHVNNEIDNLETGISEALKVCCRGARIVVISFHSLEDGKVKRIFRAAAKDGLLDILTPRPVRPCPTEIASNPRCRSARLRAARMAT